LELSNVLYETTEPKSDVKIVDFGSATMLEMVPNHPGAFKFLKERTGSVHIMAPEVLKGRYGPKADVWSLGVMAYMLLNKGQHPFKGDTV
jgi:serine/threonine protein kinase